jgi:hypothetical protein
MNYVWVFFRKPLTLAQSHELEVFFQTIFKSWEEIFAKIQPKFTYLRYNIQYQHEKSKTDELGVALQRIEGEECLKQPLIRVFFGTDNLIIFRQRIDSIRYPILARYDEYEIFFQEMKEKILQYLQQSWEYKKSNDFIEISGHHSCLLNCGKCCDGSDFTRSPLLGGRYCKAITTVGDLCLYRLYNPSLPSEDPVCGEYLCGMCQSTVDPEHKGTGCGLYAFTPEFDAADREEFFDLMGKIARKEDITLTSTFQTRAAEVEQYHIITALFEERLKPIQNELPKFVEGFLFALSRHYIDNCESLLKQNKDQLGVHYERLADALEGYTYWFDRYNNRRKQISKPIIPKEYFTC